jgi:hypothetical protein
MLIRWEERSDGGSGGKQQLYKNLTRTNNPTTTIRLRILGDGNKDLRSGIIGLGNMGSSFNKETAVPAYWLSRCKVIDPVEYKKYTDLMPGILAK